MQSSPIVCPHTIVTYRIMLCSPQSIRWDCRGGFSASSIPYHSSYLCPLVHPEGLKLRTNLVARILIVYTRLFLNVLQSPPLRSGDAQGCYTPPYPFDLVTSWGLISHSNLFPYLVFHLRLFSMSCSCPINPEPFHHLIVFYSEGNKKKENTKSTNQSIPCFFAAALSTTGNYPVWSSGVFSNRKIRKKDPRQPVTWVYIWLR